MEKDPIKGTENDFIADKVEDWEDRVFLHATHFVVWQPPGQRENFPDHESAFTLASKNPRALVYAVARTGRSCALVRSRWDHYRELHRKWAAKKNMRTYRMPLAEKNHFDAAKFVKRLKAAGFIVEWSKGNPISIRKPWDHIDGNNGEIIWRQWDA